MGGHGDGLDNLPRTLRLHPLPNCLLRRVICAPSLMTYADYYLRQKHLGRMEIPPQRFPPQHIAFFCPSCGEVWGRIVISEGGYWALFNVPCREHRPAGVQDWGGVPGSFTQGRLEYRYTSTMFTPMCLDLVPQEVLKNEFEVYMQRAERPEE